MNFLKAQTLKVIRHQFYRSFAIAAAITLLTEFLQNKHPELIVAKQSTRKEDREELRNLAKLREEALVEESYSESEQDWSSLDRQQSTPQKNQQANRSFWGEVWHGIWTSIFTEIGVLLAIFIVVTLFIFPGISFGAFIVVLIIGAVLSGLGS